jgi:phosphate-selective porin OprO/OprP
MNLLPLFWMSRVLFVFLMIWPVTGEAGPIPAPPSAIPTVVSENETDEPPLEVLSAAETGDGSPFQSVTFTNGVQFSHPEKKLQVNLRFRMQNRFDFEPNRFDWQVRRLRVRFGGFVLDPRLTYNLQLSFSRGDMDWASSQWPNLIRDAMITYAWTPGFSLAFGQGKLPGNRQRVVSSGDLQFVDRSIVNAAFNLDRDFGVQAYLHNGEGQGCRRNLKLAISTGEGRNLPTSSDSGLGYVARAEMLPFGSFERNGDYFESDLVHEAQPKLSVGVGGAFFRSSNRAGATIGTVFTTTDDPNSGSPIRRDQSQIFADVLFKYQGWSVSTEWMKRMAMDPIVVIGSKTRAILVGQGFNAQVGKMWGRYYETGLRYSLVSPESRVQTVHVRTEQQSVVVSRFFNGHRVKLQAEVTRSLAVGQGAVGIGRLQFELGI